jgi:hypothetical protein
MKTNAPYLDIARCIGDSPKSEKAAADRQRELKAVLCTPVYLKRCNFDNCFHLVVFKAMFLNILNLVVAILIKILKKHSEVFRGHRCFAINFHGED